MIGPRVWRLYKSSEDIQENAALWHKNRKAAYAEEKHR